MIAKRGDHAIDHLLAIRWRERTPEPGMRRGGPAAYVTVAGHRPSRVERLRRRFGEPGLGGSSLSFASRGSGVQIPSAPPKPAGQSHVSQL
jgi:hypothetical protein